MEEELGTDCPIIHSQTVIEDHSLQGIGHCLFFCQEVIAKELLNPVDFHLNLYLFYSIGYDVKLRLLLVLYSRCKFKAATKHFIVMFVPEESKLSHFLNRDVFSRLTGKERIILQCLEHVLL